MGMLLSSFFTPSTSIEVVSSSLRFLREASKEGSMVNPALICFKSCLNKGPVYGDFRILLSIVVDVILESRKCNPIEISFCDPIISNKKSLIEKKKIHSRQWKKFLYITNKPSVYENPKKKIW